MKFINTLRSRLFTVSLTALVMGTLFTTTSLTAYASFDGGTGGEGTNGSEIGDKTMPDGFPSLLGADAGIRIFIAPLICDLETGSWQSTSQLAPYRNNAVYEMFSGGGGNSYIGAKIILGYTSIVGWKPILDLGGGNPSNTPDFSELGITQSAPKFNYESGADMQALSSWSDAVFTEDIDADSFISSYLGVLSSKGVDTSMYGALNADNFGEKWAIYVEPVVLMGVKGTDFAMVFSYQDSNAFLSSIRKVFPTYTLRNTFKTSPTDSSGGFLRAIWNDFISSSGAHIYTGESSNPLNGFMMYVDASKVDKISTVSLILSDSRIKNKHLRKINFPPLVFFD